MVTLYVSFDETGIYLSNISGPLTILGSREFSICPIFLAIKVLPVPGGPKSKMPGSVKLHVDVSEQHVQGDPSGQRLYFVEFDF